MLKKKKEKLLMFLVHCTFEKDGLGLPMIGGRGSGGGEKQNKLAKTKQNDCLSGEGGVDAYSLCMDP